MDYPDKTDAELKVMYKKIIGKPAGNMLKETMVERIESTLAKQGCVLSSYSGDTIDDKELLASPSTYAEASVIVLTAGGAQVAYKNPPHPQPTLLNALNPVAKPAVLPQVGGCSHAQVMEAVEDNVARGMTVTFGEGWWEFQRGGKMDSGTLSQPVRNIRACADRVCVQEVSAAKVLKSG